MLQQANGNCQKCHTKFGILDTTQSVFVQCKKCSKEFKLCRDCKAVGCECGGKLEDEWDKNPGLMH